MLWNAPSDGGPGVAGRNLMEWNVDRQRVRRVRSAQMLPRVAPAKKKSWRECGNPWERDRSAPISVSEMNMAKCGSPAKKKKQVWTCFFLVAILFLRDVTCRYSPVAR